MVEFEKIFEKEPTDKELKVFFCGECLECKKYIAPGFMTYTICPFCKKPLFELREKK